MTEENMTAEAAVEPTAWFARRSTIVVASIAVVALAASIIVGVSASRARATDVAALELITASVADAEAARTACTAAVASSTASANIASYIATITDALGADSEAAKTAPTTHDKPHLIADCAIAGDIVELEDSADPSDNVDAITASNTAATATWVALATDVKALDTKVSADLAALDGLVEANTAYTTALTSLKDKLAAAQALTEGELAVHLVEQQVTALAGARDAATQVLEIAESNLDAISPMSLNNRAATLEEAVVAFASVVDPISTAATDAKATADAKAAADAAAAAAAAKAAQSAKPRPSGSSTTSPGNGSTGSNPPPATTGGGAAPAGQHIWIGGDCTGFDMLRYMESAGWTESDARADSVTKGCTSFETAR